MATNIYQTYFPISSGATSASANVYLQPLAVGTDKDNSNASGSLCTIPFVKYGVINVPTTSTTTANQVFRVPAPTTICGVFMALVNNDSATVSFTGNLTFALGSTAGGTDYGSVSVSIGSIAGNAVNAAQYNLTAATKYYVQRDTGQDYGTMYATITLGTAAVTAPKLSIVFNVLLADASTYTVTGQ